MGQCKDCGNMFLLDETWERYGGPVCRAARVSEAFKPIDPIRTALGVLHTNVDWNSAEWKGVRERAEKVLRMNQDGTWHGEELIHADESQTEDTPRGCNMPLGEAAQLYQLKRLFRL